MKNTKIKKNSSSILHIVCYLLLLSNCINAMEIVSRPTKSSFFPNNSPHPRITQPNITDCIRSSFIIFPQEIKDKIIRTLCSIPEEVPVKITIEDAVRYYHSIKKHCPLALGNRTYIADDLILLTQQQRQSLIGLANPSNFNKKMGFSSSIISNSNAQKLATMPAHIHQDLSIEVFNSRLDSDVASGLLLPCGLAYLVSVMHLGDLLQKSATTLELLTTLGTIGTTTSVGICCCCALHNPRCAE